MEVEATAGTATAVDTEADSARVAGLVEGVLVAPEETEADRAWETADVEGAERSVGSEETAVEI